jgi:hypothetical protein
LQVALGTDPDPMREQPLEMEFAQVHAGGNFSQIWLSLVIRFEIADGLLDTQVIFGELVISVHRAILRHWIKKSTRFLLNQVFPSTTRMGHFPAFLRR